MELNLKKETYLYYEAAAESPSAFETTQEAIVPDYCADVGRVVEASGAVLVHNKDLTPDGRVEVNGVEQFDRWVETSLLMVMPTIEYVPPAQVRVYIDGELFSEETY